MRFERLVYRGAVLATAAVMAVPAAASLSGCATPAAPGAGGYRVLAAPSARPVAPYRIVEVRIPHPAAGIRLAGSLVLPDGRGPFPAAVIINGSGPVTRQHLNQYHAIRDHLARRGIAVLHMDARGVGASGGQYGHSTSADHAGDVAAELSYLRRRPDIAPDRIGLLGHSEGGLIAPMVASGHDVAFVALLAAPGVPGVENLEQQIRAMMRLYGLVPTAREAAQMRAARDALRFEQAPRQRFAFAVKLLEPALRPNRRGQALFNPQTLRRKALELAVSPWMKFQLAYDPRPHLARVKAPVLIMQGTRDILVSADQSVPAIRQALERGGNRHVQVAILPGLNHFFQHVRPLSGEEALSYRAMSPDALETLGDWVVARTRSPSAP